jgi:GNAT superfamily N-acetyltransferase
MTSYVLRLVESPEDWAAMHALRRDVLFAPFRKQGVVYDENHPDDRNPANLPFLLVFDGQPAGITRLDLRGDVAVVRLVAVAPQLQRRGHGRAMSGLIDGEARRRGVRLLRINAAPNAVGFYEATGWRRKEWDREELSGIAADCVQMERALET